MRKIILGTLVSLACVLNGCSSSNETAGSSPTPSRETASPTPVTSQPLAQAVDDPAGDASPDVIDLKNVKLAATDAGLDITWNVAATIPQAPEKTTIYTVDVDRFDASGNGPSWQIAVKWTTTEWIAFVFNIADGQTDLEAPSPRGTSAATSVPWSMIGGRKTFNWKVASEWDGRSNDEVAGNGKLFAL